MSEPIRILTPVGRLVGGHPMKARLITDDKTKQPKLNKAGEQMHETYVGLALVKSSGVTDWRQEQWGQQIAQKAAQDWPAGEHGAPSFAWKVTDGDSAIPNKKGNKPCDREGYPGHWVINCATTWTVKCYHAGQYDPHQQIQDENAIKPGDYCRVAVDVKGNGPSESPGMYLNPIMFELTRAGVEIVLSGDGPDANEVFGAAPAGQLPAGAQVDPNIAPAATQQEVQQQAAAAAYAPAPDALDTAAAPAPAATAAPAKRLFNGVAYTEAQLAAGGHTPEQIASYPPAQ